MEDIHTPTIVATPAARTTRNGDPSTGELLALMVQRDHLEAELKALGAVLDSHKVNMNTPLTTFDGYPRDDIDVPQIRTTRARIIRLRNDYKDLMKKIEEGLHAYHANLAPAHTAAPAAPAAPAAATAAAAAARQVETPFAKVHHLAANSPAAEAGLLPGDHIKQFGPVNALNHDGLRKLAEVVAQSEGNPISILLSRKTAGSPDSVDCRVTIVPRTWAGQGKLGCRILPL